MFPQIESVRIPQCFRLTLQLHSFVDTSENGTAAAIFRTPKQRMLLSSCIQNQVGTTEVPPYPEAEAACSSYKLRPSGALTSNH